MNESCESSEVGAAPVPPPAPDEGDCCESECGDACVWTDYYEARALYEAELARWRARQPK